MLRRLIAWSVRNPFLVLFACAALAVAGIVAVHNTPLDALPDLSDVQVIVQAEYDEQAPRIVEDQATTLSPRSCCASRARARCVAIRTSASRSCM